MAPRLSQDAQASSVTDAQSAEVNAARIIRHHRRTRMLRFITFEIVTVAITVISALAGISTRFAGDTLTPLFRVLPIGAAMTAVILPILFFGHPEFRNRSGRRVRR
jgi:hypothetical protein